MKSSSRRGGLAFLAALTAAALTAAPVSAYLLSQSGTTGAASLRDSQSEPGVQCRYSRVTPSPGGYDYEAKLTTIVVRTPRVKAHPDAGTQKVGWLFIVQRALAVGVWSTKYVSPIQTRMTNASTNAAFDEMSVDITVPSEGWDDLPAHFYRVRVFLFWYNAAGRQIVGQSIYQVGYYRKALRPAAWSGHSFTDSQYCRSWVYAAAD